MALCRFLERRGSVRSIWSGNGTNIGSNNELQKALEKMDHLKVKNYLQGNGTDWIFKQRAHLQHHTWEVCGNAKIQTVRGILEGLLKTHGQSLNDEAQNLMAEVESINSRPVTVKTLSNINSIVGKGGHTSLF